MLLSMCHRQIHGDCHYPLNTNTSTQGEAVFRYSQMAQQEGSIDMDTENSEITELRTYKKSNVATLPYSTQEAA